MPATLPPLERLDRAMKTARLEVLLGRAREAAMALGDTAKELREAPPQIADAIPELQELMAATSGSYKIFDDSTAALEGRFDAAVRENAAVARSIFAEGLLFAASNRDPFAVRIPRRLELEMKIRTLRELSFRLSPAIADLKTLRGIFLLEHGDSAGALRQFESALSTDVPFPDRRIAERYRTLLRRHAK
jgi:hypothetical protein